MRGNTGFFKTYEDRKRGWMLNIYAIKLLGETELEINGKKNISPGFQKVLTSSKYNSAKSMNDTEKLVFRDILQKTNYYNRIPTTRRLSGRDRYIEKDHDNDVRRILNLDTKLKGRGIKKKIFPSNIIDIYTRLEVLLGLKLSGHTDTLTEASNLIDELYK